MIKFAINLFNKLKKQNPQKDPVTNPKPNSKNDLISSDPITLNEQFKGNVYCLEEVIIEANGDVTGHIHSKSCVVNGRVDGNILCSGSIEVKNTALIEGNVKAGSIEIEAGSILNGFISIDKKISLPAIAKKAQETPALPDNDRITEVEFLTEILSTVIIPPVIDENKLVAKKAVVKKEEPVKVKKVPASEKAVPLTVLKEEKEIVKPEPITVESAKTPVDPLAKTEPTKPPAVKKPDIQAPENDSWW